jgi:hypothetical protein
MENNTEKLLKENTLLKEVNEAQIFTIEKLLKENGELKEQLQKAEQDKEAMGKLLKELMANELFIAENHFSPVAAKITECLTQCGITP